MSSSESLMNSTAHACVVTCVPCARIEKSLQISFYVSHSGKTAQLVANNRSPPASAAHDLTQDTQARCMYNTRHGCSTTSAATSKLHYPHKYSLHSCSRSLPSRHDHAPSSYIFLTHNVQVEESVNHISSRTHHEHGGMAPKKSVLFFLPFSSSPQCISHSPPSSR